MEVEKEDGTKVDEECAKLMNRVTLAYEVLGDEDKRILYDTGGLESVKEGIDEDEGRGGGGMDPFSMLFGGGGGGRGRGGGGGKRGPDARVELAVSLEDMYRRRGNRAALASPRLKGRDHPPCSVLLKRTTPRRIERGRGRPRRRWSAETGVAATPRPRRGKSAEASGYDADVPR